MTDKMEAGPGERIDRFFERAVAEAKRQGYALSTEFNGTFVRVYPDSSINDLQRIWAMTRDNRRRRV